VNTPSAKAEGFSRLRGLPPIDIPNCMARAIRDWIPRLSIPRAKIRVFLEELVSAYTKVRLIYKRGEIHPSPKVLGFLPSEDKMV
jgi:hypothetical protein